MVLRLLSVMGLPALVSAQFYLTCKSNDDCDGYCIEGKCRPFVEQGQFCNLYRRCNADAVCTNNVCVDNTCEKDRECDYAYCDHRTRLCVPHKSLGEKCQGSNQCDAGMACKMGWCMVDREGCADDDECEEGQYCDEGSRKCHKSACKKHRDCSARYFCDTGTCTMRAELGQECSKQLPCHTHLECDKATSICLDPAYNTPCAKLQDSCDSCTALGFLRCTWDEYNGCSMGFECDDASCVNVPTKCVKEESFEYEGNRHRLKSSLCTRDLDCPRDQYCHDHDPKFQQKNKGMCQPWRTEGEVCGGEPAMRCGQTFTCVVDSYFKDKGICIANGALGFAKPRPDSVVSNEGTTGYMDEDDSWLVGGDNKLLYLGYMPVMPLFGRDVSGQGVYHPRGLSCVGCVDGQSTETCPAPSACGYLPPKSSYSNVPENLNPPIVQEAPPGSLYGVPSTSTSTLYGVGAASLYGGGVGAASLYGGVGVDPAATSVYAKQVSQEAMPAPPLASIYGSPNPKLAAATAVRQRQQPLHTTTTTTTTASSSSSSSAPVVRAGAGGGGGVYGFTGYPYSRSNYYGANSVYNGRYGRSFRG